MFEIFTTREVSIGIYMVIIAIIVCFKCRREVLNVLQSLFNIQLVIPFMILLVYVSIIIYCSTRMFFWKWIYLKGMLMWFIFVGVPFCFNAVHNVLPNNYFTSEITNNFKFVVLLEYVTGTYTFSFFAEMILQPFLAFLAIVETFADCDSNKNIENYNKAVKKSCDFFLCLAGVVIFGFSIKELISSINTIVYQDVIFDLAFPIVLSILFLPAAYLMAVSSKYQLIFIRMNIYSITSLKRKMMIIISCGISYRKLRYFLSGNFLGFYKGIGDEEYKSIVESINREYKEHKKIIRKEN